MNNLPVFLSVYRKLRKLRKLANIPVVLHTPAGNKAYLFYHPRSFRKFTNTISFTELHANYLLLTHHSAPLPTTPTFNNINTSYQT